MDLFLEGLGLLLVGGTLALALHRHPRLAAAAGVVGAIAGSALALIPALQVLAGLATLSLRVPWDVPGGAFHVEIDPLAAWFLVPILGLSLLAAVYGHEYLQAFREHKSLGPPWFFFNLLVACMALVVVAQNAVLFLMAWEVMALASFFLVTFESEQESVRAAGWTYLVATHLGTAFLFAFFALLGRQAGSLDFDRFGGATGAATAPLFLLALVGFGTKAGFLPVHVWLPEAHPAAPSHVSALMSGVMIKTGIYGLVRTLGFLGAPPAWWGWVLVGIGLTSGILGVLFALAQHDLKRLLAYHSVENIGIIALGLGVGLLGQSHGARAVAVLGYAGALLHVVNHGIFKGLLFLGAGSVLHATGTREIDHLGGLQKRMPWTGVTFLTGAAAISGLPPLNGFVSEFLIYLGAFSAVTSLGPGAAVPALAVIAGLALIGGLAAACFTKAFGIVFLGEPRSEHAAHAREAGWAMRLPMVLLAAGCLAIGLLAPEVVRAATPVLAQMTRTPAEALAPALATGPLLAIAWGALGFLVLVGALAWLRHSLLAGRSVGATGTWDCGYARPTARMQYTSSSYARPLVALFWDVLRTHRDVQRPEGLFPRAASLSTHTADVCSEGLFRPVFTGVAWTLSRLRWLQHGNLQIYVLYIALTLLFLLFWELG